MKNKSIWIILFSLASLVLGKTNNDFNKKLLHEAQYNNLAEVKNILANNANVNSQNEVGQTPLHLAQDPLIIHELIVAGAHINMTDCVGITPLHQALFDNNKTKAMILLYSGAKANTMVAGSTPLHWAIEHKDYELVCLLIKGGAKVIPKIITYARCFGTDEIAQLLTEYRSAKGKKAKFELLDSNGQTQMHTAAASNDPILIDALVLAGAHINCKNRYGQTPLHLAVERNCYTMVKKLVEAKAKIHAKDNKGETPFHYATRSGSLNISTLLYEHGASLYLPDKKGITPLQYVKQNQQLVKHIPILKQTKQIVC